MTTDPSESTSVAGQPGGLAGASSPATPLAVAALACCLSVGIWLAVREIERVAKAVESHQVSLEALEQTVEAIPSKLGDGAGAGSGRAGSGRVIGATTISDGRLMLADADGRLVVVAADGAGALSIERVYRLEVDVAGPGPRHGVRLTDLSADRDSVIAAAMMEVGRLTPDSMEAARNAARVEELVGRVAAAGGFDVLLDELKHERAIRRRAAAVALGEHGFRAAVGVLIESANDSKDARRLQVHRLLARLTGVERDSPDASQETIQKWRKWWDETGSGLHRYERAP